MKKVIVVAAAFFLVAALGSAAPMCTSSATNVASAGFSCTLGGLTFSNFQVIAATAGTISPEVDLVSTSTAGGAVSLAFNPNISAPSTGANQDVWLFYQVSGGVSSVAGTVGGVNATMTEHVCSIAFTSGHCPTADTLGGFTIFSAPGLNAGSASFANTGTVYLFKDISVSPTQPSPNGGGLTSFTQTITGGGGSGSGSGGEVPEPVSVILMGSGLVALSLLRKVRKA